MSSLASDAGLNKYIDAINALGALSVKSLCDLVLTFLLRPSNSNFQVSIAEFAQQNKLSSGVMKTITQGIIHHLQEAVEEGTSSQQFENKCKEIGYSKEVTDAMTSVWISQAVTVASSLLQRAMTNNQLVDMDWIFGVTASSDDFNHVGKTFLQLKLTLAGSECSKVVLIELSLEQFYQFLASMEKCKSYLDYVLPPST